MTADDDHTDTGDRSTTDQPAAALEDVLSALREERGDGNRSPQSQLRACPRCGSPISGTVVRDPDYCESVPCGCHLTDREQAGDGFGH